MANLAEVYKGLSNTAKARITAHYTKNYECGIRTFQMYLKQEHFPADVEAWLIDELEALGLAPDGTPVKRKTQAAA